MDFLSASGSHGEALSLGNADFVRSQPSAPESMVVRAGHHRRRSSLSTFFGSLTGHGKGHNGVEKGAAAVLAQNPMFSTLSLEDEELSSGSGAGGSTRSSEPLGVNDSMDEQLGAAMGARRSVDIARHVAAVRAAKMPHPSANESLVYEGIDMSMSSVMEDSPTQSLNATANYLTDASCLTSRTNVSNFSNCSGNCIMEGDHSVLIHSARSSHRLSYNSLCTDGIMEDSTGEIQNMKNQLEDMGRRFDYLEHWLGECQTPRQPAIKNK